MKDRGWHRFAAVAAALCASAIPASGAVAETFPPWSDATEFSMIGSAADPEEYTREVQLGEGQLLELVDDQEARVTWPAGQLALVIMAPEAHDAVGATVPTSLAKSGENLITFTIHHRAGNPAEGFAPFTYPIVRGPGWKGGFETNHVALLPPEVTPAASTEPSPTLICVVPRLKGKIVRAARQRLRGAGCQLGEVTHSSGGKRRVARVVGQQPAPGEIASPGTRVEITVSR